MRTASCPGCGQTFEDWFAACPFCQAALPWQGQLAGRRDRGPVLIAIFLGLGALATPALWRSPAFTPREKLWITVAAVTYSLTMVAIIVVAFRLFLQMYRNMLEMSGG